MCLCPTARFRSLQSSRPAHLPLLPFPSSEDTRGIQSFCSDRLDKAIQSGLPPHQPAFHYRFRDWSNCLLRAVESGKKQSSVAVNFQAIRLGDVAIASAAGETLSELGLSREGRISLRRRPIPRLFEWQRRLYTQRRVLSDGRMVAFGNVSRARYALPGLIRCRCTRARGAQRLVDRCASLLKGLAQ